METAEGRRKEDEHVMIFPFMAKGHMIPLLHLSSALSSSGVAVTFVTTPQNSSFVRQFLPPNPNISLVHLPFPSHPSLPEGCESTDHLPPLISSPPSSPPPSSSVARSAATSAACHSRALSPSASFPTSSSAGPSTSAATSTSPASSSTAWASSPCCSARASSQPRHTSPPPPPERRPSTCREPPSRSSSRMPTCPTRSRVQPGNPILAICDQECGRRRGELGRSRQQLHGDGERLRGASDGPLQDCRRVVGGTALPPLPRSAPAATPARSASRVARRKAPASVVYVCFGTQTHVSPEQLDKVAQGLYMSGHEFLLVARTAGWLPPPPPAASRRQGLIVRGWARQREVLVHRSTGGFVSHCGWNSMLDSLSAGGADSGLADDRRAVAERRFVVGELGAGLRMEPTGLVHRSEICEKVKELMGGSEKGRKARKKAEEMGKLARVAVADGGSSNRCLTRFMEELRLVAN
ncbi:unnamed protein product [Spirodela intermedia]|uniref:Uncharacterized protein n=1 Tax=Spirodela intermedia TaxID=51605 RepID=A0A7I8JPY8_SPIIN|nr:unnamed protein product [Spirodela intermedia]CAA6672224.1 unnamed protein product [Spirodela intermedia]